MAKLRYFGQYTESALAIKGTDVSGGKTIMESTIGGILAARTIPPWLPRDAQDARMFSYWAQILFLIMALVWFIIGIAEIALGLNNGSIGTVAMGFVGLIISVVCGLAGIFMKRSVIDDIDHGRFHDAKNACVVWGVIGIVAFILPTILLLLSYLKLSDVMKPATSPYAPYAPGTPQAQQYPAQPPQQPPAGPQQPIPPATKPPAYQHGKEQKYEMLKCKNCGVQFPAFMANCPNCGAPKE